MFNYYHIINVYISYTTAEPNLTENIKNDK